MWKKKKKDDSPADREEPAGMKSAQDTGDDPFDDPWMDGGGTADAEKGSTGATAPEEKKENGGTDTDRESCRQNERKPGDRKGFLQKIRAKAVTEDTDWPEKNEPEEGRNVSCEKVLDDDYQDENPYDEDDDYDEDGGGKIILIAVIIAAITAITGIFMYRSLTEDDDTTPETMTQTEILTEAQTEATAAETTVPDTETITPTATPKPVPTATPTPTPVPDEAGTVINNVSSYGTDSYVSSSPIETETDDTLETVTTEAAKDVLIGDVRFREMATVATAEKCGWVCSSSADYDWFSENAYAAADNMVGEGTKIFISIGLNDIDRYAEYAVLINDMAAKWQEKGAETCFVAVGPVASESGVANTDICTFNTYMYQNLTTPFIDAYNYLVANGFESVSEQSTSYTENTTMDLYHYLSQFM